MTLIELGYSSISRADSCGATPLTAAIGSPVSRPSVASTSTVIVMVSTGAPQIRCASDAAAPWSPDGPRGCNRRTTSSGLYWKITRRESGLRGSTATSAPLSERGLPGKLPMAPSLREARHSPVTPALPPA